MSTYVKVSISCSRRFLIGCVAAATVFASLNGGNLIVCCRDVAGRSSVAAKRRNHLVINTFPRYRVYLGGW